MPIDPTTNAEFKSLEQKFHVDFMNRIPSRHDIEYKQWLERRFLLRIGIGLPKWDDTRRRTWVAHLLEMHFWQELGLQQRPSLYTHIPVFLWSDTYLPPPIDVHALSARLQRLSIDASKPLCTAERKFALLEQLLHLDRAEVELLELAFAMSSIWSPASADVPYPLNAILNEVLCNLGSANHEQRTALYSHLLSVPVEELAPVFERPALVAMHLLENESWQEGRPCEATDKLLSILQGHYLTHAALIEDLKAATPDFAMVLDDLPMDEFCKEAPADMVEVFHAARKGDPLSRAQQEALVHWHTGLHTDLSEANSATQLETYERVIYSVIKCTVNIQLRGESFCAERLVKELAEGNARS